MLEDAAKIRRVVLTCGTVDLRKGIDGLSMIIGDKYHQNPFEKGTLFLFCGRRSETLNTIEGQLSFFDEADAAYDESVPEPDPEDVLPPKRSKKKKGQRGLNLKDFPEEIIPPYSVSEEQLDEFFGKGNWRRMPDETYKRLRHETERWTVEVHTVHVYVGTDGDHQDEFLRGDRPKDLLRNSIVTPSLVSFHLKCKVCEFLCTQSD